MEAAGQDLEERGLACAAGADDGEELARAGAAGDVAEDEAAPAAAHAGRRSAAGNGRGMAGAPPGIPLRLRIRKKNNHFLKKTIINLING